MSRTKAAELEAYRRLVGAATLHCARIETTLAFLLCQLERKLSVAVQDYFGQHTIGREEYYAAVRRALVERTAPKHELVRAWDTLVQQIRSYNRDTRDPLVHGQVFHSANTGRLLRARHPFFYLVGTKPEPLSLDQVEVAVKGGAKLASKLHLFAMRVQGQLGLGEVDWGDSDPAS